LPYLHLNNQGNNPTKNEKILHNPDGIYRYAFFLSHFALCCLQKNTGPQPGAGTKTKDRASLSGR
jgi:hypothetical protein